MNATRMLAIMAAGALALSGCGNDDDGGEERLAVESGSTIATGTVPAGEELTIEISEQGGSGVSGTATLMERDGETHVLVEVDDEAGNLRPTHIHEGTCDDLDPKIRYPLADTVDGVSETTVDVSLQELLDDDFAINLHESPENLPEYIACGNISQDNAADDHGGAGGMTTVPREAGSGY